MTSDYSLKAPTRAFGDSAHEEVARLSGGTPADPTAAWVAAQHAGLRPLNSGGSARGSSAAGWAVPWQDSSPVPSAKHSGGYGAARPGSGGSGRHNLPPAGAGLSSSASADHDLVAAPQGALQAQGGNPGSRAPSTAAPTSGGSAFAALAAAPFSEGGGAAVGSVVRAPWSGDGHSPPSSSTPWSGAGHHLSSGDGAKQHQLPPIVSSQVCEGLTARRWLAAQR